MSHQSTHKLLGDRASELLVERALDGLGAAERGELHVLLNRAGVADDISFDLAAASLELSSIGSDELVELPTEVKIRLHALGEAWSLEARDRASKLVRFGTVDFGSAPPFALAGVIGHEGQPAMGLRVVGAATDGLITSPETRLEREFKPVSPNVRGDQPIQSTTDRRWWAGALPWAIAACAVFAALLSIWGGTSANGELGGPRDAIRAVASAADAFTVEWADWDKPEVAGVLGSVTWSESMQRGVMKFTNLPANDPSQAQYQLWIIDDRGLGQRVNGAIFNGATGTYEVVIQPSIAVRNAAMFAVTIEQPGGTWVSDMTRRVVVAKKV